MEKASVFGERVYLLRKKAGLNQKQLGEVLGLSNKAICTLESGQRGTTIEKLVLLAEYFHVSTDYLLGITDDPAWRGGPGGPRRLFVISARRGVFDHTGGIHFELQRIIHFPWVCQKPGELRVDDGSVRRGRLLHSGPAGGLRRGGGEHLRLSGVGL